MTPTETLIAALAEAMHTHQMAIGDPMRHRCRPGCLRSYFTLLSPEARDAMLLGFAMTGFLERRGPYDWHIEPCKEGVRVSFGARGARRRPTPLAAVTAALEALDDDR